MTLPRLSLILSAIWLGIGLIAAAIVQYELHAPGIWLSNGLGLPQQIAGQAYMWLVFTHVAALFIALPLSLCFAYPAALQAQKKGGTAFKIFASVFLVLSLCGFVYFLMPDMLATSQSGGKHIVIALVMVLSAAGALWALLLNPNSRGTAILFIIVAVVSLPVTAYFYMLPKWIGLQLELGDTYQVSGVRHGLAICLACLGLSIMASRAAIRGKAAALGPSILFSLAVLIPGLMMARAGIVLGGMGMPRLYADYPQYFQAAHLSATLWSALFIAGFLATLFYLHRCSTLYTPGPEAEFD